MAYQRQSPVHPTLAVGVLAALLMLAPATAHAASNSVGSAPAAATHGSGASHASQATVTLRHEPRGTAVLMWHPAGATLTVTLSLTGLAPSSAHTARLRCAACSPTQVGGLVALDTVTADQFGDATSTTTIPGVAQGIPARGWVIEVLNGTTATATDPRAAVRIATGDISNPQAFTHQPQKVVVALRGTGDANQSAHGTAHLQIAHDTLVVSIALSGLAPGSLHAAHVHPGSCARQGPIVYQFNDLKADASGHANVTMRFSHVSSIPQRGWYVNVHDGPMAQLANPLAFDPIACGNVVAHS